MAFQDHRQRPFGIGHAEGHGRRHAARDAAERRLHHGPVRALPAARQGAGFEFQPATRPDHDEVGELADVFQHDRFHRFAAALLAGALVFEFHVGFTGEAALEADFPQSVLAFHGNQIRDGRAGGTHGGGGGGIESRNPDAQGFDRGVFDPIADDAPARATGLRGSWHHGTPAPSPMDRAG